MNKLRKYLLALLIIFIAVQFIRPTRNISQERFSGDIVAIVNVPGNVREVLKNSCYDCHSNNTQYPWYVNIQPVGWILANHIKEGKANLNFSEFGSYSKRKQVNKLKSIAESIKDGSMPLSSYTMIHTNAKLSKQDKELIDEWAAKVRDSISLK